MVTSIKQSYKSRKSCDRLLPRPIHVLRYTRTYSVVCNLAGIRLVMDILNIDPTDIRYYMTFYVIVCTIQKWSTLN